MKNILLFLFFPLFMQAQIERVLVETYYVSDANDATDTTGGLLQIGSKTYRVYIDLLPGSKLKKIYGDANHALKFSSTASFFNNKEDGQSFGKDFSKTRYKNNTVALDTWLTLGQVTKTGAKTYFGVLKTNDRDGSFVGGVNNDGGSSAIAGGLLTNGAAAAGIPLTTNDGIDTMTTLPSNWGSSGIIDIISGEDSTIFGSLKSGSEFISNNVSLQNSGVSGVLSQSNDVLIAQLTTAGEISFELNIEVIDSNGNMKKYVANADTLLTNEFVFPNLKYPPACGCNDPNYLEYNANYACGNSDSCRTLIVFGCTDPMACNYNPNANFPVPSLCCYPGACNDLDISLVCPHLSTNELDEENMFGLYPNPAEDFLTIEIYSASLKGIMYEIYDYLGRKILEKSSNDFEAESKVEVNVSALDEGLYLLRITTETSAAAKMFVKN
ncbi:MAG: T9SS type A sorting domain-containing protein [Bacteroidetes bacterium]|nr:T9SS type A sorting domain-containing protein [Bacteroidota bacterium]